MPTITLVSNTRGANGKWKATTTTANVTHNNARLYYHTDRQTYEFVGLDASSNRIYRNAQKVRQ